MTTVYLDETKPAMTLERGDWLRAAVPKLQPGDVLDYGTKDIDLGTGPGIHLPQYTTLVGRGGTIYSQWRYQLQCCIELNHGCALKDVRVIMNNTDPTYPGVCVGFSQANWSKTNGGPAQIKAMQATIEGGYFQGKEYGLYVWGAPEGCRIIARNKPTFAGKIGACLGTGSGPTAGFIDLYEANVIGNMNIARTGGASGVGLAGLLVRGGVVRMFGGTVSSIAVAGTPAADQLKYQAAVWLGMADQTEAVDNIGKPTWASCELQSVSLSMTTIPGVESHLLREGISAWPGKKAEPGRLFACNCVNGSGKPISQSDCYGTVELVSSQPFPVGA